MRKTTAGRILAVQALYQHDLRGQAFADELQTFLKTSSETPEVALLAEDLFYGFLDHRDEVDAAIAQAAEHWKLERMATVDRAILRLGAYELMFREDVPPKVAINEAIRLAKKFGAAESGAFVNGILDRVMGMNPRKTSPEALS